VDATADRKAGVLRVDAIHEDEPFSRTTTAAVRAELDALAGWLGLTRVRAGPRLRRRPGTVTRSVEPACPVRGENDLVRAHRAWSGVVLTVRHRR
jgi:hypothetical protein